MEGGGGVATNINHHYSFTSRGKYSKSIAERYIQVGVIFIIISKTSSEGS